MSSRRVALLTFNDGTSAIAVRNLRNSGWHHGGEFGSGSSHDAIGGFEVRPVAVLDPEAPEDADRLSRLYDETREAHFDTRVLAMQLALRAYVHKYIEIEEPYGLGAVVEDESGQRFTRISMDDTAPWYADAPADRGRPYRYFKDLNAVRVLSLGVEEDS